MRFLAFQIVLLVTIIGSFLSPRAGTTARQECAPQTFRGVATDAWECAKVKLISGGFTISQGNAGQISRREASGDFAFDPGQRSLTITIRAHSYSCQNTIKGITEIVDSCRDFEEIHLIRRDARGEHWRIDAPNVKQPETEYRQIKFRRGDSVNVRAGGCAQHGGSGFTWALYVDPEEQNPTPDFYGLIRLPGMTSLMKIKDVLAGNQDYVVPNYAFGDMFLKLGFSDFRHTDNGYWGRAGDDGYNDQCKGKENAWVEIKIVHR